MAVITDAPHIFLIGSTGRTGRSIIKEALCRGHTLTALAREPASLSEFDAQQHLNVVQGSPTSASDQFTAMAAAADHAADKMIMIISTLGQTRKSGNPWAPVTSPPMFMTQAAEALLSALESAPVRIRAKIQKLIVMSMFGAGQSFDNLHCLIKPVMKHSNMKQTLEDHNGLDEVVRSQKLLEWTMVRPAMLREGGTLPVKVQGEDGLGKGWVPSSVTIGTVVDFMLDACVSSQWVGKTPVLCN